MDPPRIVTDAWRRSVAELAARTRPAVAIWIFGINPATVCRYQTMLRKGELPPVEKKRRIDRPGPRPASLEEEAPETAAQPGTLACAA